MSERRVRLLYKTTCWTCGAPVAAGTTTWWDDERQHATCTGCFREHDPRLDGSGPRTVTMPGALDPRTRRRLEIMRSRRPRAASR